MPFVQFQNASFSYPGGRPVVDDVSWDIEAGQFHCLLGRSGCGKTTLLKLVAGLLRPSDGKVALRDESVTEPNLDVSFVFQSPTLLAWKNVEANVLLPLALRRQITAKDRAFAAELLSLVGLSRFRARYPDELSGGQQSRVAIARALVADPVLLLMDEPFAALDAITREELQNDFAALCVDRNTTVLFVTHDIAEAVYLADTVAIMEQGRFVERIAIDIERPRGEDVRYSAQFNAHCRHARSAMNAASAAPEPSGAKGASAA